MRAVLIYNRDQRHQRASMTAMAAGMSRHGIDARLERSPGWAVADDDFVVTWCDKELHQTDGAAHLILECGYVSGLGDDYMANRLRFVSASWNQRHGLSDWRWPEVVSADRWETLGIELQPWKQHGEHVLLLEQMPADASAPDVPVFRRQIIAECARRGWRLRVRPHPRCHMTERTLADDLAGARLAITWCSTAAVEAVVAGVPTYVLGPGSISAPVTRPALADSPYAGDRTTWAHRIAYRQWTLDEMASGLAWPHIHSGLTGVH